MTKKANTVVFILAATLFNVLVTIFSFLVLLITYSRFLFSLVPENVSPWIMPVLFVFSIVISFLIYRAVMNVLIKKKNIEKYIDPLFAFRKQPGKH